MKKHIGFMQGRLSPIINGKIQSFPWETWRNEFKIANINKFELIEWTLDQKDLYQNPLMNQIGSEVIKKLKNKYDIKINSLTGDCFMQSPFWKCNNKSSNSLKNDFISIVDSCSNLGIKFIVVPLVDNSSLENAEQETILVNFLLEKKEYFLSKKVMIIFESDFSPCRLRQFIEKLDPRVFGINYDLGNSAALGFCPVQEFKNYGARILNVHVKDRTFNGGTVPLGEGSVDFKTVFTNLKRHNYNGDFILQTARSSDQDHITPLCKYRSLVYKYLRDLNFTQI